MTSQARSKAIDRLRRAADLIEAGEVEKGLRDLDITLSPEGVTELSRDLGRVVMGLRQQADELECGC